MLGIEVVAYLAVEKRMKGVESEKACAEAQQAARAAVKERRIAEGSDVKNDRRMAVV